MSPAGVDEQGRFLGNIWHVIHTALWNPLNVHRILGNMAFGGGVVAAYAAYKFLAAKTDEDRAHYDWMGYIAMAVDMYGNGRMGNDPGAAQALATPFYMHPDMAKKHFDAALEEFKKNPNVDQSKIAGIGYCFGGGILLNLARMGEPLNGVVSFHGSLVGTPADKNLTKAEILVCHGEADSFVPKEQVDKFKKQMDSIGKSYTFKSYPGATHAFTNPDATETGKKFKMPIEYNAAADTASWNDMKEFFGRIFK